MLDAGDQVVVEPGARLVEPLQLELLRPGVLVCDRRAELVDVAVTTAEA